MTFNVSINQILWSLSCYGGSSTSTSLPKDYLNYYCVLGRGPVATTVEVFLTSKLMDEWISMASQVTAVLDGMPFKDINIGDFYIVMKDVVPCVPRAIG